MKPSQINAIQNLSTQKEKKKKLTSSEISIFPVKYKTKV